MILVLANQAFDPLPYPTDLTEWVEVSVPQEGTVERRKFFEAANRSRYSWFISVSGDQVSARLPQHSRSAVQMPDFPLNVEEVHEHHRRHPSCAARTNDGWLVSYNVGEWGGSVWWFSTDGKKRYQVLKYANVEQFVTTKDGLFAVQGLSHLSSSKGSIERITKKEGRWVGEQFAKLPAAGHATVALADGTLVVGTGARLTVTGSDLEFRTAVVRVTKDGKIETLLDFIDHPMSPVSIAVASNGTIYLGMEQFVVTFDPAAKPAKVKYLVPRKDFLQMKK